MILFRVSMTGHGLQLRMDNAAAVDAGFVKNEFVVARSEHEARTGAIEHVREQLEQQAAAGGLVLKTIDIEIDEVARSRNYWKLVQPEGFVFFPEKEGASGATVH